jgi:hypothetical protein
VLPNGRYRNKGTEGWGAWAASHHRQGARTSKTIDREQEQVLLDVELHLCGEAAC